VSASISIVWPNAAGTGYTTNLGSLTGYPDTTVSIDTTTVGEKLSAYAVALDHWISSSWVQEQTATPTLPSSRGTHRRDVTFTNLTPGDKYRVRVAVSGDGGGSDTASRIFRHACGEVVYPISMVSSPESVAITLAMTVTASWGNGANAPVILYRPASGTGSGTVTGSWTTTPPVTYPATPYLHIKVRVAEPWTVDKISVSWRAT
jgi:hypothetical protein